MASHRKKIQPRTVPGALQAENHGSLTWGWHAVAYGCRNSVVVVDAESAQVVQVLEGHKSAVTKICWQPGQSLLSARGSSSQQQGQQTVATGGGGGSNSKPNSSMHLRLVSGDAAGRLIVWDVHTSACKQEFGEPASTGKAFKSASKRVVDVAWLPPQSSRGSGYILALHAPNPLVLWHADTGQPIWKVDFGEKLTSFALDPFNSSRLVVLTDVALMIVNDFSVNTAPQQLNNKYRVTSASADGAANEGGGHLLGAQFSHHDEEQLFLVFKREILLMDLEIHQTVGSMMLERGSAAFATVAPCARSPTLFCLHSNGLISIRRRQQALDGPYQFVGQSEALRLGKHSQVQSIAVDPRNEYRAAAVSSDGRVLLYQLDGMPTRLVDQLPVSLADPPNRQRLLLKRCIAATGAVSCMEMCPGDTHGGTRHGSNSLLAAGSTGGAIQLFDLETGHITRQFQVHVCAVKMLDWSGSNQIVSFATEEAGANFFRNMVSVVQLDNGRVHKLRHKGSEDTQVEAVRCSPLGQYVIVTLRGRPLELWDMQSRTLLKTMPSSVPMAAGVEWLFTSPQRKAVLAAAKQAEDAGQATSVPGGAQDAKSSYSKEHFIIATPDGHACHFTVEGSLVRNGMRLTAESTLAHTTCIAWKGDHIVIGDSGGNLIFWDAKNESSKAVASGHGAIKTIRFSPGRSSRCMSVSADGVVTWDAGAAELLTQKKLKVTKANPQSFVAAVWSSPDRPVVASTDGCLRIYDVWLQVCTSPLLNYQYTRRLQTSFACLPKVGAYVANTMRHQPHKAAYSLPTAADLPTVSPEAPLIGPELFAFQVTEQLVRLPKSVREGLLAADGLVERGLITALYYGDPFEVKLWTMVQHVMSWGNCPWPDGAAAADRSRSASLVDIRSAASSKGGAQAQAQQAASEGAAGPTAVPGIALGDAPPYALSSHFGIMSDPASVRDLELARLRVHESRQLSYELLRDSTERHVLLGQHEAAVQMLLETDARHDNFYADSLRACVIAAVSSPQDSQNTIKLVAMNLIASGKLMEGVELLCLIGNGLDACRYLQTYGEWHKAAKLAKATLDPLETAEVLNRWVEHLSTGSTAQREHAVLVALSFGQARKAVSLLHALGRVAAAAALLELLEDRGAAGKGAERQDTRKASGMLSAGPSLVESVFLSYAKELKAQGHTGLCKYYAEERAGTPFYQLEP